MQRILEIKTVQSTSFRTLIEALKEILEDVNIEFTPKVVKKLPDGKEEITGGMRILAINPSGNILAHLKLDAAKFDKYECHKKQITIGLFMPNLFKLIKTMNNNDTLTLFLDGNDINHLGIKMENKDKNSVSEFQLKLMDIDEETIEIPKVEFTSVITMPSADFHKICRDMHTISDIIEIKSMGKKIIFSCKGEFAGGNTTYGETSDKSLKIETNEEDEIVQGIYDLKNLILFTKCTSLSPNMEIYMKNDYPLIIKYGVGDLGKIQFCLSPLSIENNQQEEKEDVVENEEEEETLIE